MPQRLWILLTAALLIAGCREDQRSTESPQTTPVPPPVTVTPTGLEILDATGIDALAQSWPRKQIKPAATDRQPHNLLELHARSVKDFILSPGFGFERMPLLHVSPDDSYLQQNQTVHLSNRVELSNLSRPGEWRISSLQLVGLAKESEGVAYLPRVRISLGRTPKGAEVHETRPLSDFETDAVQHLRDGADLVLLAQPGELRLLGSLRANQESCVKCHKIEQGTLLGAMSYELKAPQ